MYKVILSACGNIDHLENPNSNIVNGISVPSKIIETDSIDECQRYVHNYIDAYDLGAGNWSGGYVFNDTKQIGYISYNGRYWEKGSTYYNEYKEI